ncbi:hypothetical protein FHT67_005415 [Paenibacillus sp. BK720]|nr:hypothetical protein [Paenibacillus sp. BK720]
MQSQARRCSSVLVNLKRSWSLRHFCRLIEQPISLALTMRLTAEHQLGDIQKPSEFKKIK